MGFFFFFFFFFFAFKVPLTSPIQNLTVTTAFIGSAYVEQYSKFLREFIEQPLTS